MAVTKPTAEQLLAQIKTEQQMVIFDGADFLLFPQPGNPYAFRIHGETCNDAVSLIGWTSTLMDKSWAHPALIRQFIRKASGVFLIDISTEAKKWAAQ